MVYVFFGQKARSGASINKELDQELRKQVNKKFEKYTINVRFKDEICAAVLTEMVSLPPTNPGVRSFANYVWGIWKIKKTEIVLHDFVETVNESNRKPKTEWAD